MLTLALSSLLLVSCSAAPASPLDYWDQFQDQFQDQVQEVQEQVLEYRKYLPDSFTAYLNETLEDGKAVAFELYEDWKEEVLDKSLGQVDAMTKLMKKFIERVMAIREDIGAVLEQNEALSDEEIQERNDREGLQQLRERFDEMEAEIQTEVTENESLPEGVEQVIQTFITTIRELMRKMANKEAEFWSKLKQTEVQFWELKSAMADSSSDLRERVSAIFLALQDVDLNEIGNVYTEDTEDLTESVDEPRAS
jgi:hypothetical protein